MSPFSRVVAGLAAWLSLSAPLAANGPAVITVEADDAGPRVNPRLYGIFLEEINHGVDGGLYAELVRNRAFEDSRPPEGYEFDGRRYVDAQGFRSGFDEFGYTTEGVPFWTLVTEGGAEGAVHVETTGGVSEESAYCARLEASDVSSGRVALLNDGFFGIGVKEGADYRLSLSARSEDFRGPLIVRLENQAGEALSNEVAIDGVGGEWREFTGTLTANETTPSARLAIQMGGRGAVWLDFVSLFPQETWNGRANGLRADIAQMIADLNPGFVRFPGGCVVEGGTVETAYNWKLTVGPLEKRQERWGPWNYRRTQGMGLFEYLQFCEDLGAAPLWVGFCGQTCIFREREHVPMSEMGWVRDNFLDLVEYANGATDTKWGAMRADAGHPEPFGVRHVEIGNENQGREYLRRYQFIHEALKEKHPDLEYLADLSWTSDASMRGAEWDIEDRHYYNSPRYFISRFDEYDDRDRDLPPLYLGEVAVTSGDAGPLRGNLRAALAEGVFLLGCERNADTVSMVSYAPLLGNVEGRTALTGAPPPWHAMIYFDGTRAFGTVSYHLWKLLGQNCPDQMVSAKTEYPEAGPTAIAGQVGIGTWDATAEFRDIRVEHDGEVLFTSAEAGDADGERERGRWSEEDGVYRQGRRGFGMQYFGEPDWSDYTLTLKARKLSGGEGFLIVFGRQGEDRFWWNLGGWGNRQHAIEQNQTPVGRPARGTIEEDRWYDVKIELQGARVRCYLDGELVHDAEAERQETFYVNAGRTDDGFLVIKAINLAEGPQPATVRLRGIESPGGDVELTVLTSGSLADNNSLRDPENVVPGTERIQADAGEFTHEFPPRSLSIIRVPDGS